MHKTEAKNFYKVLQPNTRPEIKIKNGWGGWVRFDKDMVIKVGVKRCSRSEEKNLTKILINSEHEIGKKIVYSKIKIPGFLQVICKYLFFRPKFE